MLGERDMLPLFEMLDIAAAARVPALVLEAEQKEAYFLTLQPVLTLFQIREAFTAHARDPQRGRFFPQPSDLIAQVMGKAATDGRLGAEEAWAMIPRRPQDSVVWSEEMAQAWEIARPLLAERDDVAARMAFKEAYARLCQEARTASRRVVWTPCLGSDKDLAQIALQRAVQAGRISGAQAGELHPALAPPDAPLALDAPESERPRPAGADERAALREVIDRMKDPDRTACGAMERLKARRVAGESLSPGQLTMLRNYLESPQRAPNGVIFFHRAEFPGTDE